MVFGRWLDYFGFYDAWSLGVRIASRAPDQFGRLLVVGGDEHPLSAFTNIASMLALIPFAGTTLPFVSQEAVALFTLAGGWFNFKCR